MIDWADTISHFLRAYSAVILTAILALTGWGALQFLEVRDGVRELRVTVPIEVHNLDQRITRLEALPVKARR